MNDSATNGPHHCPYCGHRYDADDRFCRHCGRRLDRSNDPAATLEPLSDPSAISDTNPPVGPDAELIDDASESERTLSVQPSQATQPTPEYDSQAERTFGTPPQHTVQSPNKRTWWIVGALIAIAILLCCCLLIALALVASIDSNLHDKLDDQARIAGLLLVANS